MPVVQHVNGFYPCPVPVSLTDEAAVFASGALYRVDARMRARRRELSGSITQVVQTEGGIFALTWARNGRAELVTLDGELRVLGRRTLLRGGGVPLRELVDPRDMEDWRNQMEFFLLTEEDAVRLSFQTEPGGGAVTALILERTPLAGGETLRRVIGGPEIEAALGGDCKFGCLDVGTGGETQMWACRDRVFLNVSLWEEKRPRRRDVLFRIDGDGSLAALWDPPEGSGALDGRACFFDFDRNLMWTLPRLGEEGYSPRPPYGLRARRIASGAPVLRSLPAWENADCLFSYFDGRHAFFGEEGFLAAARDGRRSRAWPGEGAYPVVLWGKRLLLDLEGTGRPKAYPVRFNPVSGQELQWEEDVPSC